jgi:hypothetical protein
MRGFTTEGERAEIHLWRDIDGGTLVPQSRMGIRDLIEARDPTVCPDRWWVYKIDPKLHDTI